MNLHDYATQFKLFRGLRMIVGCIWIFNVIYQLHPSYIHHLFLASIAARPGQDHWYQSYTLWATHLIAQIGAPSVAYFSVFLGALFAASLITGFWVRPVAWIGMLFTLIMWTLNGHLGGPYTEGATDPGTLIVYSLLFIAVLVAEPIPPPRSDSPSNRHQQYRILRLLFGLLWTFDAIWKWTPFFLHHFMSNLTPALAGQPAWIVAYIQFFIDIIRAVGPERFAILVALIESVIALSLLTTFGLKYILPLGFLYSLALWTTAEGWGGPYGAVTGVSGNVLGTTIIYAMIFLYLMVMYPPQPDPSTLRDGKPLR